ncbi:MaoC/PaaZ C-terminal domain-containing protein [uncultured Streptomyces sp.]|uniref:MaoC family dehydratase n=1 Tax=uncultured Streptomyces sp. TaxID=174707 RepID=UPI002623E2FB|nr:MaoC/PaaZ C-terminal domain-containing protein [uncultured Streptomyces sp.]
MDSLTASLVRGAAGSPFKRAGRPGAVLPADRAVRPAAVPAPAPLARYRALCGHPSDGPLPLPYPHVLGFPLAMRLMTARAFPLPVLGLVHTWITLAAHRPLDPHEPLGLTVYADGLALHRRGTEVTLVTEARVGGSLVWESRSGYLARHRTAPPGADAPAADDPPHRATAPPAALPARAEWRLPADLGRRYGAVSGDRNPIHLHPLTARLFGFPRAIAHGMWTVARCLAENDDPAGVREARADFRAPVLLPSTVTYTADPATGAFALRGGTDGARLHLTGTVRR